MHTQHESTGWSKLIHRMGTAPQPQFVLRIQRTMLFYLREKQYGIMQQALCSGCFFVTHPLKWLGSVSFGWPRLRNEWFFGNESTPKTWQKVWSKHWVCNKMGLTSGDVSLLHSFQTAICLFAASEDKQPLSTVLNMVDNLPPFVFNHRCNNSQPHIRLKGWSISRRPGRLGLRLQSAALQVVHQDRSKKEKLVSCFQKLFVRPSKIQKPWNPDVLLKRFPGLPVLTRADQTWHHLAVALRRDWLGPTSRR